jgi:hypothetical protein
LAARSRTGASRTQSARLTPPARVTRNPRATCFRDPSGLRSHPRPARPCSGSSSSRSAHLPSRSRRRCSGGAPARTDAISGARKLAWHAAPGLGTAYRDSRLADAQRCPRAGLCQWAGQLQSVLRELPMKKTREAWAMSAAGVELQVH